MKSIILLISLFSSSAFALDLNVDIENGPLGVSWGATEKEIIATLGEPNGHFILSKNRKIIYYGKKISLFLKRGKLNEIMFTSHADYSLSSVPVVMNSNYDKAMITINGKRVIGMPFDDVADALNMEFGAPGYHVELATDNADINLHFSSSTIDEAKSYTLHMFKIKHVH